MVTRPKKFQAADKTQPNGSNRWHALSTEAVLAAQQSGTDGLTDSQASERLARVGPNRLPPPKRRGPILRFLAQFHDVLIYVLLGAAALTALMEHWVDTQVVLAVVLINAVIGFLQEGKAEKALEAIRNLLAPKATVVREGRRKTIPGDETVPGDLVLLDGRP